MPINVVIYSINIRQDLFLIYLLANNLYKKDNKSKKANIAVKIIPSDTNCETEKNVNRFLFKNNKSNACFKPAKNVGKKIKNEE